MFNQIDVNILLGVLAVGRNNALTAFNVALQIGYPTTGNQVKTRKLIKYAIENGCLIKSSTANPPGFWLSNNKREISSNIISLRRRAQRIINSANNLEAEWNRQNPNDLI